MKKRLFLVVAGVSALAMAADGQVHAILSPRTMLSAQEQAFSRADATVSAYITVERQTLDRDALTQAGIDITLDLGDLLTVRMPKSQLQAAASVTGVKYVQISTPAYQMLDIAKEEAGVDKIHAGASLSMPYTGKGVVVGVIDKGFDYTHPAFYDADGNLRIKRVWEQATDPYADLSAPAKYGYGIELSTPQAITNARADVRNNSHGTHVTSIATGSDTYLDGVLCGVAPSAHIVLVSMTDGGEANVDISNAIAYIFDYADEVGLPCVVNLSLGAQSGPHDGTSTFDVIADRLQGPGRLIVGAAGNHRAGKFHISRTFTGADAPSIRTFVKYPSSISKSTEGDIEIWGSNGAEFEVALLTYQISNNTVVERVVIDPTSSDVQQVSLGRNISGNFSAVAEASQLNGKPHILLHSAVSAIRNGYRVGIEVTPKSAGTVDIWADNTTLTLTDYDVEGFVAPTDEPTICEIGGTAKRILTVGAYTTRNSFKTLGSDNETTIDETVGAISSFSSYGPTADGRLKPQIAAPGCLINAAVSLLDYSGSLLFSDSYNKGDREVSYAYMQGTSMSSPFVAGVVATWLEAYPELTPEALAEIVSQTARTDQYTGSSANYDFGYGKIDALAGLKECITRGSLGITDITTPSKGLASLLGLSNGTIRLLINTDISKANVSVYDILGAKVYSQDLGNTEAGTEMNISCPTLTPGTYLLVVSTPASASTIKLAF